MRKNDKLMGRHTSGPANSVFGKSSGLPGRLSHPPPSTEKHRQLDNIFLEQSRRPYLAPQTASNKHPDILPDKHLDKHLDMLTDKHLEEVVDRRQFPGLRRKAAAEDGSESLKSTYNSDSNNYLQYKDYVGKVEFSASEAIFSGKVIGIKSLVSFEGDSVSALVENFRRAIDDYFALCNQDGKQPEKPFKGTFNVRIGADLHRKAALAASERGISLNALVENAIRHNIER
jgi:predicted HicB family RNase H-like nuclease